MIRLSDHFNIPKINEGQSRLIHCIYLMISGLVSILEGIIQILTLGFIYCHWKFEVSVYYIRNSDKWHKKVNDFKIRLSLLIKRK